MKAPSTQVIIAALAISILAGCAKKESEAPAGDESAATVASEVSAEAAPVVSSGVVQEYVPATTSPGGDCFLDAVNGGPVAGATAKIGQEASFGGWVSDTNNQVPTTALFVLEGSDKSYSVPLVAGGERPDVAAALSNEALQSSGFNVIAKLDAVAPGEYSLAILLGADRAARCELNAKLAITN